MPTLIGELEKITGSPSSVTQVMVRAHKTRITGAALTTDELVPIPVDRQGRFEVPLRPGKAVLVLVHGGRVGEGERFPMLVEEGLGTITSAIKLASDRFDDYELDELERAAADMLASLDKGLVAATRAEVAQEGAENAKKGSEDARDKAGEHRDDAKKAAGTAAAKAAEEAVEKASEKLSGYISTAQGHVTAAQGHAGDSAGSATAAGKEADRAETARQGAETIEKNLPTKVGQEVGSQLPGALTKQLPAELDERVPPKVAEAIAKDDTLIDAAVSAVSGVVDEAIIDRIGEVPTYEGMVSDLNAATGKGAKGQVYYFTNSSALNSPGTGEFGGLVEVTASSNNRQFVQTFYRIDGPGVWKRNFSDRTHVGGSWSFADWSRLDNWSEFRTLTPGEDANSITEEGTYPVPASGLGITGLPGDVGGTLVVHDVQNGTDNIFIQVMITAISEVEETGLYWRTSRSSDGAWSEWRMVGEDSPSRMMKGSARRDVVVEAGLTRRGRSIGTGGLPAVALRFDHHLTPFGEKVLPVLKRLRLPWGQMLCPSTMGTGTDGWTWDRTATECHESGGEAWNHSWSHVDVFRPDQADREITRSMERLKERLPSLWIDGWAPPGQSNYMGYEGQNTPEKHWETYPGRLILAQHAFIRGYYPGIYRKLNGPELVGVGHTTIDKMDANTINAMVRGAMQTGSGVTLMLHPTYLDRTGYLSTADLTAALEYIASLRDSGQLVVLSPTGIMMADRDLPRTTGNITTKGAAGTVSSSWSETVWSREAEQHYGVPHEAEVWVKGSGTATLTVEVTSGTYPVTVEHAVTLGPDPQRLSVAVTPPMDTTAATITLTGTVTHTGIRYRPI